MSRTIYHGSGQIVRKPVFTGGRANNDFGLGFYCTEDASLAREWAVTCRRDGFMTRYTIDTAALRIVDLGGPQYTVLHWLAVLLAHRVFDISSSRTYQAAEYIRTAFSPDYQGCDCIAGYRADNVCFTFAQDFLDGSIGVSGLRDLLARAGGRQFVLKSNRAIERLAYSGYMAVEGRLVMPERIAAERIFLERAARHSVSPAQGMDAARSARRKAYDGDSAASDRTARRDLYITDILEQEITPYDSRLR